MNTPPLPAMGQPRTVVGAVVNAAAILRHLGASEEPQGVTAIAQALSLSASSCFNILRTLAAEDLVEFDSRRKLYSLGLGLYDIACQSLSSSEPFALARTRSEGHTSEFQSLIRSSTAVFCFKQIKHNLNLSNIS